MTLTFASRSRGVVVMETLLSLDKSNTARINRLVLNYTLDR
jgi:hypothetical protein